MESFTVLRNAGVSRFQCRFEYLVASGCLATGAACPPPGQLCLACRGLAFWEGGSWRAWTLHPIAASLPREHHSSLPAPPSASGRPGLGAVGRHFLCSSLQSSLEMTLVPLEAQWQKTKLQMNSRKMTRFLELFCVCRYIWYFKSKSQIW